MDNKTIAKEWFDIADMDLSSALYLQNMPPVPIEIICYYCQQASEKYLKGYPLSKGWQLEWTHDLAVLLDEAVKYKPELDYRDFQSRYPFKVEGPKKEEVEKALAQTKQIIQLLLKNNT